ncbi:peptidoglycan recognition protein family protein [Roseicitreum antarcticum]|nr:peptidoglycan-binding domain-containing protein [Roseicitreum antarcticum]
MNRLTWHHTGGGYVPNAIDLAAYHGVIDGDGGFVQGLHQIEANAPGQAMRPGAYAAHTARLNTGNIGISVASMAGGKWADPRASRAFPKPEQIDALMNNSARLCVAYGIAPDPRFTLTHAEVEPTLGVKQRQKWDFDYPVGFVKTNTRDPVAIGNELRQELAYRIKHMANRPAPIAPATAPRPILRQGSHGNDVRLLQAKLGLEADGIFGPETRAAVAAYQKRTNLLPDGVVGTMTWDNLLGADQ